MLSCVDLLEDRNRLPCSNAPLDALTELLSCSSVLEEPRVLSNSNELQGVRVTCVGVLEDRNMLLPFALQDEP